MAEERKMAAGALRRRVEPARAFDPAHPRIKQDILAMILQYLEREGYSASMLTLQDESNVRIAEETARAARVKKIKKAILAGQWKEVEELIVAKQAFANVRALLYAVYKQQYLEMIDRQETQKAFSFLDKKLKQIEHLQTTPTEFGDLCYLLTCKSVQEAPSFRDWQGVASSREKLAEQFQSLASEPDVAAAGAGAAALAVPDNRMLRLLQQGVAYQMEFGRHAPVAQPTVTSLLVDYESVVLPNVFRTSFHGHSAAVKCLDFVGEQGRCIVSGGSDNALRLWETESGACLGILNGHEARVWSVASSRSGRFVASASADASVKLWDVGTEAASGSSRGAPAALSASATLRAHKADVYSVMFHPAGTHVVSGGFDGTVRLFDASTAQAVRTLAGHGAAVTAVAFNPLGNLVVSGSKDNTVRFWDVLSGTCVKTLSKHLSEVTSVAVDPSGAQVLTSSKDNAHRLWDLRASQPLKRFKGHQNTSKNFVRSGFGPSQAFVVSGSQDASVCVWDIETEQLVQQLRGHAGAVYSAVWNAGAGLLASCSHDRTVATWECDPRAAPPDGADAL